MAVAFAIGVAIENVEGQGIDISVDVDGVSVGVAQQAFRSALPANMTPIYYDDSNVSSAQLQCPIGYFCPANSTVSQPCPSGTYQDMVGKIQLSDCKACPTGSYCPNPALPSANTCTAGYMCPSQNMINATICPPGTYQASPGQLSCTQCSVGHKCNTTGMTSMIQCGIGKYQPLQGQTTCIVCPAGQICTSVNTQNPAFCNLGDWADPSFGGDEQGDCRSCPAGQVCPQGTTSPVNCTAGTYKPGVGGSSLDNCTTCPPGQYCEEKSINPADCPSGTFRNVSGARSVSDCVPCPAGKYCIPATSTPANCLAGRFNPNTGGKTNTDCLDCPAGQYCGVATVIPTNCSAGTFNPSALASTVSACGQCTAGKYCGVGTSSPIDCPVGTYLSTQGGSLLENCISCSLGTFDSTTTGRSSNCGDCPIDNYCTSPLKKSTCPSNTVSVAGSNSQLSCRCIAGFVCSYTKKIKASFTLNITLQAWNSDLGGVRTNFKAAIANAAGVDVSNVIITNTAVHGAARRLLGIYQEGIDISADVQDAHHLSDIKLHIKQEGLLQAHSWHEAHSIHTRFVHKIPPNSNNPQPLM